MRKISRVFIVTMAIALTLAFMPAGAFATTSSVATAKVTFTSSQSWGFDMAYQTVTATSDLAEKYYPAIAKNEAVGSVSFADAIVAAHIAKYGSSFKNDPTAYLNMTDSKYGTSMNKQFGHSIVGVYYINNVPTETNVSASTVKTGDILNICAFSDDTYSELFSYFDKTSYSTKAGSSLNVTLKSLNWKTPVIPSASTVQIVNKTTGDLTATSYKTYAKTGVAAIKFAEPGTYYISATGSVTYAGSSGQVTGKIMAPLAKVTVGLNKTTAKLKSKKATSVKVTWKKVTGAKKYQVYRATKKSGKYTKIKTTAKTSYTNKKLKNGKHYFYKVRAINGSTKSAFSKIVKK